MLQVKVEVEVEVEAFGGKHKLQLLSQYYKNGRLAIEAFDNEGPFGRLTVNIPEADLDYGEIIVKTWEENREWVPQVLEKLPEYFADTGLKIPAGYVEASVWRLLKPIPEGC